MAVLRNLHHIVGNWLMMISNFIYSELLCWICYLKLVLYLLKEVIQCQKKVAGEIFIT